MYEPDLRGQLTWSLEMWGMSIGSCEWKVGHIKGNMRSILGPRLQRSLSVMPRNGNFIWFAFETRFRTKEGSKKKKKKSGQNFWKVILVTLYVWITANQIRGLKNSRQKNKTYLNSWEGHDHAAVWFCHRSPRGATQIELAQPRCLCSGSKVLSEKQSEMLIPEMEI